MKPADDPATTPHADHARDDQGVIFGQYHIYPNLRLLLRNGTKIDIGSRAFDVLWMLVQANGELVSKDHLIDTIWSGSVVEENNLQAQMSAIRRVLGSDRDMIRTEFGRGYRLIAETTGPISFKPPATGPTRPAPSALPRPLTPLLGRADDLAAIEQIFTQSRLVTITGAGGMGKTRLAIEIGRRAADQYPDGVHLIEMVTIPTEDLVGPAIAAALQISPGDLERPDYLTPALRDKRLLLIMDNCEHLVEPIAQFTERILQQGSGVRILITSQEPLGIDGEQVYRLEPLSVPAAGMRDLRPAMEHAAFALFLERASASGHDLTLDEDKVERIGTICRRLDGLPLALELAAARVATLGVQGVLAALDNRFQLLTGVRRTALPRHRTLRATIDWSYYLLTADEQRLFRRLAIFAAGFDADAAAAVAAHDDDDPWSAIDLVSGLVSKSLLLFDPNHPVPRYRFLESIRFYALEKLAESGEVDLMAERHASHFAGVVRRAAEDWKVLSTENWRQSYGDMADDVRVSLDWGFSEKGDARTAVETLADALPFWTLLSLYDEAQRRTLLVLNRNSQLPFLSAIDEMKLNAALGTALSWAIGPVKDIRTAWDRALTLARQHAATEFELQAQYGLWLYSLRSGRYADALRHANEMTQLATRVGDAEAFAVGQRIAGVAHHFLGHHSEARALTEVSIQWHETNRPQQAFRFGFDQRIAGLAFLSRILWVMGFADRARALATRAVAEARDLDHANTLCGALAEGTCTVNVFEGDHASVQREAKALMQAALGPGLGFWRIYGELFDLWAKVRSGAEIPVARLDTLLSKVQELDFDPGYSILLTDIALAAQQRGEIPAALANLCAGIVREPITAAWAAPEFRRVAVRLHAGQGSALPALRAALILSEEQQAPAWSLRISVDLAEILMDQSNFAEASAVLDAALSALPRENSSPEAEAARRLAARLTR